MFEFEYTLDASVAFAGRKMLKKYFFLLLVVVPLIGTLEYWVKFFKTKDYSQLTAAVLAILLFYLISFVINRIFKRNVKKNNSQFLNQKVNILFSDSQIEVKTKKEENFESSQTYSWNMIQKFEQDKSYYFVYLSKFRSYVIPKGSCTNGNEADFSAFVKSKLAEKKLTHL